MILIRMTMIYWWRKRFLYNEMPESVLLTKWTLYFLEGKPDVDPSEIQVDGRYNHTFQVQERLNFLRYSNDKIHYCKGLLFLLLGIKKCCILGISNREITYFFLLKCFAFSLLAVICRFLLKDGQLWLCEPQAKLVSSALSLVCTRWSLHETI